MIDINRYTAIRSECMVLKEQMRELAKPTLTDFKRVPEILEIVRKYPVRKYPGRCAISEFKQRFIFVVLMLYDPTCLLGDKMRSGLRVAIAEALEASDNSMISHIASGLLLFYNNYKLFRHDVDSILKEINFKISMEGNDLLF